METIKTMSEALTFISKIEEMNPRPNNLRASFDDVPLIEIEKLAKQERLEIFERDNTKGVFFWQGSNCYVFWNETKNK